MSNSPWNARVTETVEAMMKEDDDTAAMWTDVKTALEAASNRPTQPCVLSDKQIMEEMKSGEIVILPCILSNLGNCSYDITLGQTYYRQRYQEDGGPFLANSPDTLREIWAGPHVAQVCGYTKLPDGCKPDDQLIILKPGESILAHSQEVIGARARHTTMMRAKSTTQRCCLSICNDGGWGDVGFVNRWSMVIKNQGNVSLALKVGMKIAQIVFLYTGEVSKPYSGNYVQSYGDAQKTLDTWDPNSMLPKK